MIASVFEFRLYRKARIQVLQYHRNEFKKQIQAFINQNLIEFIVLFNLLRHASSSRFDWWLKTKSCNAGCCIQN